MFCSVEDQVSNLRGCTMTLAGTNDWAKLQSLKILTKLIDTEITKHTKTQTYTNLNCLIWLMVHWYPK